MDSGVRQRASKKGKNRLRESRRKKYRSESRLGVARSGKREFGAPIECEKRMRVEVYEYEMRQR